MTHELVSEIKGVVELIKDFRTEALLPVFEAVVNSIQAIEDANMQSRGHVTVRINRAVGGELELGEKREPEIESFEIIDDGVGFTDDNTASFMKFGSTYKLERGGKGIGRFTWLKAFDRVNVESVYLGPDGKKQLRKIEFTLDAIKSEVCDIDQDRPIGTSVKLSKFKKKYRSAPSACRTGQKIAQRITEHCLCYFMAEGCPQIEVQDVRGGEEPETISLDDIYAEIKEGMTESKLVISGEEFKIVHLKLYSTNAQVMHNLVLCANGREVQSFDLKKEFGTGIQFDDDDRKFTYAAYVMGDYLDKHVSGDRMMFELQDEDLPLDPDNPIGLETIKRESVSKSSEYLQAYLNALEQKRVNAVQDYVSTKNPALRFVPHYCPEAIKDIDPNTSDEKIDEILYSYKGKAEYAIRKRSAALLKTHAKDVAEIVEQIHEIEGEISDVQKSNLANYMLFRKMIIDLLDKRLGLCDDGKFVKEDVIHDIFMPRKTTSDELNVEGHNLWLLDERLTFHHFAASDEPLKKNMASESIDRPDIMLLSDVDQETREARSVVIVEFKRPERTEYQELITDQVYRMRDEIEAGKLVSQSNGKHLIVNSRTRYYCYAICDFTDKVRKAAERGDYEELPSNLGFFKYHSKYRMACYIINFDQIVTDAKKRHQAFFEKLGIN